MAVPNPLPETLRAQLADSDSPWRVSPGVRDRLQQDVEGAYQKTLLTPEDLEYAFVSQYFEASPPRNRLLGRVYCIHTPHLARQFESTFSTLETQADDPFFAPKWETEDNVHLRRKVMDRWTAMTSQFSPFSQKWEDGRKRPFRATKILPLWQGSNAAKCNSICKNGFITIGKHEFFDKSKPKESTDIGYFGSGIYFTPSLRYADLYSTDGNVLLAWTCMGAPYPVIADKPWHPWHGGKSKPKDMEKLGTGLGAYQKYTAHYIPVCSTKPTEPDWMDYYPCAEGQNPMTDEIVVFAPNQTLPRFWVQLEVALPKSPPSPSATIGQLIQSILTLYDKPFLQADSHTLNFLQKKVSALCTQNPSTPLRPQDRELHKWVQQLLLGSGKVSHFATKKLAAFSPHLASLGSADTMLGLIAEDIHKGDFAVAYERLLLQLTDVKPEDFQTVYGYLDLLLDYAGNSAHFSRLEHTLSPFLQCSPHLPEEQQALALKLSNTLLHLKGPSPENQLLAMEYYAVSMQIGTQERKQLAHKTASCLLFQSCLDQKGFEEQLQAAKRSPSAMGQLIDRLENVSRAFCSSPEEAKEIRTLYEKISKELTSLPPDRAGPYREHLRHLLALIPQPSYTPDLVYPTAKYQQALGHLRESYQVPPQDSVALRSFQAQSTQAWRTFFQLLETDLLNLLGPSPCRYQVRATGSLGREEPLPFSPIELIVLVEEKTEAAERYFTHFLHGLDLQLRSLGETQTTPAVFPATKNGLKLHSTAQWLKTPDSLSPQELQLTTKLLQENLALSLQDNSASITSAKHRALSEMQELSEDFTTLWPTPYSTEAVDIEKKYALPLYRGLSLLALYFGIRESNTLDLIEALRKKKVFAAATPFLLEESISALYRLRVQTHMSHQEKAEEIEGQNSLLEKAYWLILRPLYRSLARGVSTIKTEPTDIDTDHFERVFHQLDLVDVAFEEACQFTTTENPSDFAPLMPCLVSHFKSLSAPITYYLPYFEKLSHNARLEPLRAVFFCEACDLPGAEPLYAIPNREGVRFSFANNYARLYESLRYATQPTPSPVKILSPCLPEGSRYLTPATIQALHLNQDGNLPKNPNQAHPVISANGLYFKQDPGNCLMEYAIHNLFSRLGGELTPPNELVRFEVETADKKTIYPVLISQEIPGATLKVALKQNTGSLYVNVPHLTRLLLGSLLTRPGDGHLSNYIFNQGNLFCIDNDLSFVEPVFRSTFGKEVNFCSALFFLFPGPLDTKTLQEFVSLDVDAILNGWIKDVIATEQKYTQLFTEQEQQSLYGKDPKNRIILTILFKEGALATLNLQFCHLQNYLKAQLRHNKSVTALDLLAQLICIEDTRTSTIGPIIRAAYEKTTGSIEDKLKQAVGRKAEQSLTLAQYHEKVFRKIPSWQEIKAKQVFSPIKARQELLQALLQHSDSFHITKTEGEKISLQADFGKLTEDDKPDETRQTLVLKALQFWANQQQYISITLRNCAVLDTTSLAPFLQDTVQHLDVSYCPRITTETLVAIRSKCPRLKELSIEGCVWIGSIEWWDPTFPSLEVLSVNHCSRLRSIKIKAPALRHLSVRDTSALTKVELDLENFPQIEMKGSSCVNFQFPSLKTICRSQESLQNAQSFYLSLLESCPTSTSYASIERAFDQLEWVATRLEQQDKKISDYIDVVKSCIIQNNKVFLQQIVRHELPPAVGEVFCVFGTGKWATHFGDVGEAPSLPVDIGAILLGPCPFWPGKHVFETHMLTLIPERVNGQPLTLELMGKLVEQPRQGEATKYRLFDLGKYIDSPVQKAHWVLMTRDVLEGTRRKSYADQRALVAERAAAAQVPYEVPFLLDATVSIFVEYVRSGVRLYPDKPWTYTRCQEKYNSEDHLAVGGFAPAGLLVHIFHGYDGIVVVGVAGVRKFGS